MNDRDTISSRLESVRGILLRKRLTAILILAAGSVAGGLLALEVVERFIHPWRESVAGGLVVALVGFTTAIAMLAVCRRLLRRPSMVDLAKIIEDRHPELMDSLVSAAEREPIPVEARRVLERALIESVNEKTTSYDFTSICVPQALRTPRLLGWTIVILILLAALSTGRAPRKAACGLLTWQGRLGPAIEVTPGDVEAPERSDVTVTASVRRWPGEASIEFIDVNGFRRFPMNRMDDGWSFTFYDLTHSVRYRVETPSAATPWFDITVFTPPELESLEWRTIPPDYTGLDTITLDALRDHSALFGSRVQFDIRKKPSVQARLIKNGDALPFQVDADGKSGTASFTSRGDATLSLKLTDGEGRGNTLGPITLECVPDLAPVIQVISPGRDVQIPPDGKLRLTARSGDDFGVDAVNVSLSISGKPRRNFPLYPVKMGAKAAPDLTTDFTLDVKNLGAGDGDVISYYFTATDNRRPNPQTTRSNVHFVEIRPKIERKEGEGGGEKKEMEIFKLIAELKRLIRFSYDFPLQPEDKRGSTLAQLKTSFSDLITATIKQIDDVGGEKLLKSNIQHPIIQALSQAIDELRGAKRLIDRDLVEPSIPNQERALARFTALAHELMKNQTTGEGEGKSENQSDTQKSKKSKEEQARSLKQQLDFMKRVLNALRSLADRQGTLNAATRQLNDQVAGESEFAQLTNDQSSLQSETDALATSVKDDPILKGFRPEIQAAETVMGHGVESLKRRRSKPALRSGLQAHAHLLSAAESLSKLINRFVAANIQAMAERADALSKRQQSEAKRARRQMKNGRPSKATAAAMKKDQDQLRDDAEDLSYSLERLAGELQKDHPEATQGLMEALRNAERNNLDGTMKRASNALLYRRPDKAVAQQEKAVESLTAFAKDIRSAAANLPKISADELANALRGLLESEARLRESGAGKTTKMELKRIGEKTSKQMAGLAEKMGDANLSQVARAMKELSKSGSLAERSETARRLLMDAAGIIQRRLLALTLDRKLRLNRKLTVPPEKYRRLVEEYFKSLSDEKEK